MSIHKYLSEQRFLPSFMRDFHDQKDLFKGISQLCKTQKISWVDAHIYVIDCFLRFMAIHGYTLQKTRVKNMDFKDILETIRHENERRDKASADVLNSILTTPPQ